MRLWRWMVALSLGIALSGPASAGPVRFVAFGDMPYDWPKDLDRFARLIESGNRLHPDFMVHLGDIKTGGAPCTEGAYRTVLELLEQSDPPLFYTPGDNEWTDCRRPSAGGWDPEERLTLLRRIFFPPGRTLGRYPMDVEQQSADPNFSSYVEHQLWRIGDAQFATLHVVGSNNNRGIDAAGDDEHRRRMRAVFAWIERSFAQARTSGAGALVLLFQADPLFELPFPFRSGFNGLIFALEREAEAFGKPVLIVHGDSHRLVLDRPGRAPENRILTNLYRLIVPGGHRIEGILVTVDPAAPQPFAFATVLERGVLKGAWEHGQPLPTRRAPGK
jgi:hypothetical protein